MQIHFDTGNAAELAAVAAMIAHLRGEPDIRQPNVTPTPPAPTPPAPPATPTPPAPPSTEDGPDAAAAFGAGPIAPEADTATTAAEPVGSTATPTSGPATLPNPGGVPVDKNGLPWDGRIHAGTKTTVADGSWRKKVGVTTETVAAVEAELRAALGAPAAPATEAPAAPLPPVAPVPAPPVPPAPVAPVPMAAPVAPVPTPPAAATAPGPAAATTAASAPASTFAELMRKITGLQAGGNLSVEQTAEISAALGISGVRDLITRPDLVPAFDALLPVVG